MKRTIVWLCSFISPLTSYWNCYCRNLFNVRLVRADSAKPMLSKRDRWIRSSMADVKYTSQHIIRCKAKHKYNVCSTR
jgi:hypothetical protein